MLLLISIFMVPSKASFSKTEIFVPKEICCLFKYCKKSTDESFTPTQVIIFPISISESNLVDSRPQRNKVS